MNPVICSASPGPLGGLRSLLQLRMILGNIAITALPDQVAVGKAYEAFNEDGSLKDEKQAERIKGLGAKLAQHLAKHLA